MAQIAVSLMLLTGAGLLLRSLWKLENAALGMHSDRVVMAHFTLGAQRYARSAAQAAFFSELELRLASLPGVEASALSDSAPPSGGLRGLPYSTIEIEGRPRIPQGAGGMVAWRYVTPGYFSALEIPIVRGRAFQDSDRAPDANAVILNATLARRMFPNESAVGKHILKTANGQWSTVVGVAGDVKNSGAAQQSEPEFYLPRKDVADAALLGPGGAREAYVIARTAIAPGLAASSLRTAISAVDPTLPVELQTMRQRLGEMEARPRFDALLLSTFAATGVMLAGIGLFGVMSFLVSQRTREIGVRMALGATPGDIVRWTLGHVARWTFVGLAAGLAGSLALARLMGSFLFEVRASDPGTLFAAMAFLCCVALLASVIPARRAARVAPTEALRQE
jgi:predicted permease